MSKLKSGSHKKAMYGAYKSRGLAGKNKERRLLAHIARHPNDNVADAALGRPYNGKTRPSSRPFQDREALAIAKQDRKLFNLSQHSPDHRSSKRKTRRKRPDGALTLAFRTVIG